MVQFSATSCHSQASPDLQDKVESFWKIAKAEVGEVQASLRTKDREAEEAEDRHQIEIKVSALFPPLLASSTAALHDWIFRLTSYLETRPEQKVGEGQQRHSAGTVFHFEQSSKF